MCGSNLVTAACPAGAYCKDQATTRATLKYCPPGAYCPSGSSAPTACPSGTYRSEANGTAPTDCSVCPAGYACAAGATAPSICTSGTYTASVGQRACARCDPGSYQPQYGATACVACTVGSYCEAGAAAATPCPSGSYSTEAALADRSKCAVCEPGHWCSGGRQIPCLQNFFNPLPAATNETACERCPPRSQTRASASASADECICEGGRFYNRTSDACDLCLFGTACPDKGTTVQTMVITPGYYRLSSSSLDVRRCPDASVNCSDAPVCPESTSGCSGTASGTAAPSSAVAMRRLEGNGDDAHATIDGCRANLTGTFCQLCAPRSDGLRVFYSAASSRQAAQCKGCFNTARDNILIALSILAALALAALVLLFFYAHYLSELRRTQLRDAWHKFTPHVKLKILVGFYLISTQIGDVYEVELPPEVKSLLATFSVIVSFGFDSVGSVLECLNMRGYVATLAVYMVTPGLVALLILLFGAARLRCLSAARRTTRELLKSTAPYMLQLLFISYPLVTNVAFEAFTCHTFTESEWLKTDVSIECGTAAHDHAKALAWVAIVLYPIGLLVFNGALLLAARRAIISKKHTALSRATAFLHREYKPLLFWWELVEMFRRFVLVGLMVLAQDTMMQLIVGILLATAFMLFQVQASPYKELADDLLASLVSFALVVMFACSIAFKYAALTDLSELRPLLTREQQQLYILNNADLTFILIACVVGALIGSFVIFALQLTAEGERLRREARASQARRLRWLEDGDEVEAPAIEAGNFHLFLSHVWGTGQDQMRVAKQRLLEMIPDMKVFLDVDDLKVPDADP